MSYKSELDISEAFLYKSATGVQDVLVNLQDDDKLQEIFGKMDEQIPLDENFLTNVMKYVCNRERFPIDQERRDRWFANRETSDPVKLGDLLSEDLIACRELSLLTTLYLNRRGIPAHFERGEVGIGRHAWVVVNGGPSESHGVILDPTSAEVFVGTEEYPRVDRGSVESFGWQPIIGSEVPLEKIKSKKALNKLEKSVRNIQKAQMRREERENRTRTNKKGILSRIRSILPSRSTNKKEYMPISNDNETELFSSESISNPISEEESSISERKSESSELPDPESSESSEFNPRKTETVRKEIDLMEFPKLSDPESLDSSDFNPRESETVLKERFESIRKRKSESIPEKEIDLMEFSESESSDSSGFNPRTYKSGQSGMD